MITLLKTLLKRCQLSLVNTDDSTFEDSITSPSKIEHARLGYVISAVCMLSAALHLTFLHVTDFPIETLVIVLLGASANVLTCLNAYRHETSDPLVNCETSIAITATYLVLMPSPETILLVMPVMVPVIFNLLKRRYRWLNAVLFAGLYPLSIFSTQDMPSAAQVVGYTVSLGISLTLSVVFRSVLHQNYLHLQNANAYARSIQREMSTRAKIYATTAHELRTPAATIKMLVDELRSSPKSLACEKEVADIADQVWILLSILDDMQSPEDRGKIWEKAEFFGLSDTLDVAAVGLVQMLSAARMTLKFDHRISSREVISRDSRRIIVQVIQNLIKNSILHSQGSKINVTSTLIASTNGSEPRVSIEVHDDGVGIPEAYQAKMFDAYARAQSSAAGSGLGLYVAKSIIESGLPNGTITYRRSDTLGGSCFEIRFDLIKRNAQVDEASSDSLSLETYVKGSKILILEDSVTLQLLTQKALERAGAFVSVADNGAQALSRYFEDDSVHEFDLIITDINMPEMDGMAFTKALRKKHITTVVVGLTGIAQKSEEQEAYASGIDVLIKKPLDLYKLCGALRDLEN